MDTSIFKYGELPQFKKFTPKTISQQFPVVLEKITEEFKNIEKKQQKRFLLSILLGTNIGILLQQVVFKTLPIGVGWALLSTSPVISLFFAKNEEREITKKIICFTCFLFFGLTLIIL